MIIRNYQEKASEKLNLNNPRQTKCSLGGDKQYDKSVSKRRDLRLVQNADNHKVGSYNYEKSIVIFSRFVVCRLQ